MHRLSGSRHHSRRSGRAAFPLPNGNWIRPSIHPTSTPKAASPQGQWCPGDPKEIAVPIKPPIRDERSLRVELNVRIPGGMGSSPHSGRVVITAERLIKELLDRRDKSTRLLSLIRRRLLVPYLRREPNARKHETRDAQHRRMRQEKTNQRHE